MLWPVSQVSFTAISLCLHLRLAHRKPTTPLYPDLTVPYTEQITTTLPDAFEAVHSIVSSLTKSLEDHLPLVLPGTVDHLITKYGALSEDDRLLLLEQSQAFLVNMAQGAFDVVTQEPLVDSHRLADVFALFVSQLHASTKSDSWGSICLLHGKLSRMSTADIARLFNLCLRAKPAVFPLVFAPHADDRYLGAAVAEARRVHQISQRVLRDIAGDAGSCVNDLLLAAVLHMSTKRQFTSGASGSPGTLPSIPFINDPGTSTPSQAPAVLSSTRQSAAVAPRVGNDSNEGMNQDVGSSSGVSAERFVHLLQAAFSLLNAEIGLSDRKPLSPGKSPNKAPKATHQSVLHLR